MEDITTVDVKVTPILKEFIQSVFKSDTIRVGKNDLMCQKIKYLLKLPPKDYKPERNMSERIKIELINFEICRTHYRIECRNFLDTRGQKIIFDELNKSFKEVFHNYVLAYVRGNSGRPGSQKKGIEDFCEVYNLSMDHINYEMLKKSWDRSKQKELIKMQEN